MRTIKCAGVDVRDTRIHHLAQDGNSRRTVLRWARGARAGELHCAVPHASARLELRGLEVFRQGLGIAKIAKRPAGDGLEVFRHRERAAQAVAVEAPNTVYEETQ